MDRRSGFSLDPAAGGDKGRRRMVQAQGICEGRLK
jgi:hypothetical protein